MRSRTPTVLFAVGVLLLAGCASICTSVATADKATNEVNCGIAIAQWIDANAVVPLIPVATGSTLKAITAYHAALPAMIDATLTGLAAYEAGTIKDYKAVLGLLVTFYENIAKVIVEAGQPDPLANAKAAATAGTLK